MASLIAELVISGSRTSTGAANASGTVNCYIPGTTTEVDVYTSSAASVVATQPITLDEGGRINRSDYPDGIWVTRPIRLLVKNSAGATVSDSVYTPGTANNIAVDNDGFTGTTLDEVLDDAYTSLGGQDWKYKESASATARTVKAKFSEIGLSVKDFGATGDGLADDTAEIQATIDRVKVLGGGVVYFPPGTYLVSAALTLSSANGIRFVGSGMKASILKQSNATANVFTISTCNDLGFQDFDIIHATSSTGSGISLDTVVGASFVRVGVDAFGGGASFRYGANLDTVTFASFYDCRIVCQAADASARGILWTDCSDSLAVGGRVGAAAGNSMEFTGSGNRFSFTNVIFGTVLFAAGLTPNGQYVFVGGTVDFTMSSTAMPEIKLLGTGLRGYGATAAAGGSVTPELYQGNFVRLRCTSGGAGTVTVNAPAKLPQNLAGQFWDFEFGNGSGGAVTWTLNAVYKVAAAIPTTDGRTIAVRFVWDDINLELREVSRAETVT